MEKPKCFYILDWTKGGNFGNVTELCKEGKGR